MNDGRRLRMQDRQTVVDASHHSNCDPFRLKQLFATQPNGWCSHTKGLSDEKNADFVSEPRMKLNFQKFGIGGLLLVLLLSLCFTLESFALLLLSASFAICFAAFFWRKWAAFLLIGGSAFFALSLAEIISGISLPTPKSNIYYSPNHYKLYNSKQYPFGSVPSAGTYAASRRTENEIIYRVNYTIGSDGFRVTPSQILQQSGPRINLFGGSFMFGEGLNDDETIAYYTSQYLPNVAVKNYGMHGWGVHNAFAIFEHLNVKGSVNVLLTGPFHALRSSCVQWWTANHPKYQLTQSGKVKYVGLCGKKRPPTFLEKVMSKSYLYSLIRSRFFQPDGITRKMVDLDLGLIAGIKAHSELNGQKLIVGFIKGKDWKFSDGVTNSEIYEAILEIADEVVDLSLSNMDKLPHHYYIHERDKHPSAEANSERARLLQPELEKYISY